MDIRRSSVHAPTAYRTSMDMHRTAITHMEVGYEDNAGAIIFPWLLTIYRPSMDMHRIAIHGSLRYTVHPWT